MNALTAREDQVLRSLARGESNKETARRLGLGDQTVKFHKTNLYEKLGAKNSAHAVMRAVTLGILPCGCPGGSFLSSVRAELETRGL